MKLLAFTIYDEKAEVFARPFFTPAIGVASRMFHDLAKDLTTDVGRHPEDYSLYHIGYYRDDNARFDNNETPVLIGRATDYVETAPAGAKLTEIKSVES